MQRGYRISIVYFLVFSLLLLLSSVMIFEHKIGFSVEDVVDYYRGDDAKYIVAKSYLGTLKVILAHIFAFGLLSMVLLHFIVFTKYKQKIRVIIFTTYITAFLELFSPFVIIYGFESFAYVKLLSFIILELLVLYILWILFFSIVYE